MSLIGLTMTTSRKDFSRWILFGLALVLIVAGISLFYIFEKSGDTPDGLLEKAREEKKRNQFEQAELLAARAWKLDPQLSEATILAGDCAAAQSAWPRAADYYERSTAKDARTRISIGLREAEIRHRRLNQIAKAERVYRSVLALNPDNVEANTGLAQLMFLCGRNHEGIPHILRLVRQEVETDMLLLLARGNMVVNDVELLNKARVADSLDPNPNVGLAWHAIQHDQFAEAEELLNVSLGLDSQNIAARSLLGNLLLSMNRTNEFAKWIASLPPDSSHVAEIWQIRGQMSEVVGETKSAIHCYWKSLCLAPESKTATFRLIHCLSTEGETSAAIPFRERLTRMQELEEIQNRVLFTSDQGQPELLGPLATAYESSGRVWEAYGWCQFAINVNADSTELVNQLARLKTRVQREPLNLVTRSENVALSMDLSRYPLSELKTSEVNANTSTEIHGNSLSFQDDARLAGLEFQYFNGVNGPPTHRMFEFTGGGIAVLDFDLDDNPDLYFTQGCAWPPGSPEIRDGDQLYRNRAGIRFDNVTRSAGIMEAGFGQGVTIGDFDADGFPDVYVANTGRNQLWRNQGDGTFADVSDRAGLTTNEWTTSVVMVDLTGDGLPDLYDVNYAGDQNVFDRVCRAPDGSPVLCLPSDFHGQQDRLWRNRGDGGFDDITAEFLGEIPLGLGLGVAVWDADGDGRLSLFVANDTTPCFFFRPEIENGVFVGLRERAAEAGVAFNGAGKATGCMGVAIGDFDDNRGLDFLITNFYAEPNTLFVNTSPGFYEDQTRGRGLEAPSINMLGFGTQFLDVDLDGKLELFVSNGHVDDLSRFNRPYRMPPQLFRLGENTKFVEFNNDRLGDYFQNGWIGRAVARIDWNRDGREDLVIGHLHDQSSLLTNTTANTGRSISLKLIGVQSSRDAIGTTVQAKIGAKTFIRQLTAGDGYHSSNQRLLTFGAAGAGQIDELIVRWPSGLIQKFENVAVPGMYCLRESHSLIPQTAAVQP